MKICFVSDSYPRVDRSGGIGVYTRTAAQTLAARRHEVHVLLGKRQKGYDTNDGSVQVHVRLVRWIPILGRWLDGLGESFCLAWALFRLHRRYRFDVVEFPNWEGYGLVAAFFHFVPVVVRLHTSMIESVAALNRLPKINERYMIWQEKMSARLAKAVVTHSDSHRKSLQAKYGLKSVEMIPHGIEWPKDDSHPSGNSLAVLCVGAMNPRKGADTLLAAIPIVLRQIPEAEFWLVGSDADHAMEKKLREMHPEINTGRVKFLGRVEDKELSNLYADCAVYASASVYESFGLTFVEAMARAKPVVGCSVSAMPELISHEENGLLVPPNDPVHFAEALVRLLSDRALRIQFGLTGYEKGKTNYSSERMAKDIECFFQKVITT
ncbi:MAG: glycosyltransferase family 4 protein [Verrucomicrobiota bacterium]